MAKQQATAAPGHPNDELGLGQFDYSKMTGAMYEQYIDLVKGRIKDEQDPRQLRSGGIDPNKTYTFDVYNVRPRRRRLYPMSKTDKTTTEDGFTLFTATPHLTGTRMPLRHALQLNEMLYANIGGANNNPIYYYLLQQPPKNNP